MSNFNKRAAAAALMTIILLFLTLMGGCSAGENRTETEKGIYCLKQNNVEIKTVEMENFGENAPASYLYTKLEISGLSDSSVQSRINSAISDKYIEIVETELPPYRGIYSAADPSAPKESEIVSMNAAGSFNNILSIMIICNVSRGGIHYTDIHTMNFDLNTGEEITLSQLFQYEGSCDVFNRAVGEKLDASGHRYGGGNVHDTSKEYLMLSAFKGIKDDQKFYLSDDGIHLVFDYTNPEFYLPAFVPYEINIGFDEAAEAVDLNAFDVSEESLFTDTEEKYLLVYGNEDRESSGKTAPEGKSNLHFSMHCTYPAGLPDAVKSKAEELDVFDDEFAAALKSEAASAPSYQYGLANDVSVNHIGKYYNVVHSVSYYRANFWGERVESFVYDTEGNPVEIADVFKEGADYESVIKKSIEEKLSKDFPDGNYEGYSLDEIYSGISFALDAYGMQIKTQPIKFTMESGGAEYESSASIFIPYEKFGCDQMTIFN
ncbi:MAG: hypothetical protein Q4C14_08020 [Bacillota bacterium]|nr:hypothetical protein [Bacillota bacterium]